MSFMVADSPAPIRRAAAAELERPTPTARRAYSGALRRLDAWLAGRPLEDATLAAYLAELHDQGRAPPSAATAVPAACFRARLADDPTPAGKRTARVLAGFRRTAGSRGRGPARPFGAADFAAVLATCHQPRRRGRGRESEEIALDRSRLDAVIVGLLFMGGMRRSEVSALRWADVDDATDGDGVLVTVRRGKTNQEGETRDVRFVKGAVAGAVRTLRAAASPAPEDPRRAALAEDGGAAVPGRGPRRRHRARDRSLRPGRAGVGAHEPGRVDHRRDARRELEDEPDGGALLGRGDRRTRGGGAVPLSRSGNFPRPHDAPHAGNHGRIRRDRRSSAARAPSRGAPGRRRFRIGWRTSVPEDLRAAAATSTGQTPGRPGGRRARRLVAPARYSAAAALDSQYRHAVSATSPKAGGIVRYHSAPLLEYMNRPQHDQKIPTHVLGGSFGRRYSITATINAIAPVNTKPFSPVHR